MDCVFSFSDSDRIRYVHNTTVDYLHRSAADFLWNNKDGEKIFSKEEDTNGAVGLGFIQSQLAGYSLGCTCYCSVTELSIQEYCDRSAQATEVQNLLSTMIRISRQTKAELNSSHCHYGWFHQFSLTNSCRARWPGNGHWLDVLGFVSSLAYLEPVRDFIASCSERVSAYYKGYLVICACRGTTGLAPWNVRRPIECLKLVQWLVSTGADLSANHLIPVNGNGGCRVRNPFVECCLLLLKMLGPMPDDRAARQYAVRTVLQLLASCIDQLDRHFTVVFGGLSAHNDVDLMAMPNCDPLLCITTAVHASDLYSYAVDKIRDAESVDGLERCVLSFAVPI